MQGFCSIINVNINETYICFIPKETDAIKVGNFRPISLTNCQYKFIPRVLMDCLKKVLLHTINDYQSVNGDNNHKV